MGKSLRDYGFGQNGETVGKPTWEKLPGTLPCPHCGGELVQVKVRMKTVEYLKGGSGTGQYLGCPCCPFASPMVIAVDGVSE